MATTNSISQQLLDLLATRNFHPEMLDKMGRPSDAEDAKTFTFDYISGAGKNYGTMVIVLDSDNEMKIMYGDNLGRTMEGDDKSEFFDFLQHLNQKARSNRWTHSIADINQLKHTMQGMAAIQEGLFEGYYGTRRVSYAGEPTQARLQIIHSQPLGEGDARYRHIDRMFIETAEGEKFKLGFKSLSGARAMLEHVRQGGKPYDIRGCHITETVNEIAVLSRFNRASANRILEGVTQELVTEAQVYYQTLRENLKHMASGRGYAKYFESWHPATINEQEGVVDNIKTLFIEQSIDSRIEAALPLLAKIQQRGHEMKEADIFENWINNLAEGTWTLPETPEQLDKLKTLMTKELIVGPDATNATEQLYDLVGDDELFDRLHELADQDPRANCWNDTEVMNRLAELGIELPEPSATGNPAEPQTGATAPVAASVAPNPAPQQPVAEDIDEAMFPGSAIGDKLRGMKSAIGQTGSDALKLGMASMPFAGAGASAGAALGAGAGSALFAPALGAGALGGAAAALGGFLTYKGINYLAQKLFGTKEEALAFADAHLKAAGSEQPQFEFQGKTYPVKIKSPQEAQQLLGKVRDLQSQIDEADNLATFESTLDTMRKAAGVPILKAALLSAGGAAYDKFTESRLMDSAGETLQHILNRFKHEVRNFEADGDLDDDLYHALYDYYSDNGEMPYGTMKARTGDPYNWISDRLAQELGINEGAAVDAYMAGKSPALAHFADQLDKSSDVKEGSCNMTMEGEYCPEHGLAECGTYEDAEQQKSGNEFKPNVRGALMGAGQGALLGGPVGMAAGATLGALAEDNEIVRNARKLNDGWKGTLAGSAAGGIAGDMAGAAVGPAAGAALGGAIGGVPGAIAGGLAGAAAGPAIGSAIGGLAGGKIGDKLGGNEETDEDTNEESPTVTIVKGAQKAATQGIGDLVSGSGK